MLRRFNAPGGLATTFATTLAVLARQQAAVTPTDDLIALFTVNGPDVVTAIEADGPTVVDYFGNGTIPIVEVMSIAILEAVVHGLDLSAAIDVTTSSIPAPGRCDTPSACLRAWPNRCRSSKPPPVAPPPLVLPVLR